MALFLVTPVTTEPVSLVEAKLQCRVDTTDEDALLTALISAAREHGETFTHRALAQQTWDWKLDDFPCSAYEPLVLPKPPVTSITSISYVDANGTTQTWSSSNYVTDLPAGPWAAPARIAPAYGLTWPSVRDQMSAATVRFVCGYTTAPEAVKAALKLLIAHWYRNRESVGEGQLAPVPHTVDALLWPFKAF